MITIFCTPKNFEGIFDIIQKNAIRSWRSLSSEIEIIIFGDSLGAKDIANEVDAIHYPHVKCSKNGVPLLSDLFYRANILSSFNILTFINADIILPGNFLKSVKIVDKQVSNFLTIGHRWDLDVKKEINFNKRETANLFWEMSKANSKKNSPAAIDFFVFKKDSLKKIPDFVIGRPGYDNWLIWYARRKLISVIDISNDVRPIHQKHHYNFHNLQNDPKITDRSKINLEEDGLHNRKLHGEKVLNILDANYLMIKGVIIKKRSKEFIYRNLGKLPIIFPEISIPLRIYKKIYRMILY